MTVDNSELIAKFMPETDDGDTFLYTELLDRNKSGSNNRHRLMHTFYHKSRAHFEEQMPHIRFACEQLGVRAYTRLNSRSYKKVGKAFTLRITELAMQDQWKTMRHIWNSVCGTAGNREYWLYDFDAVNEITTMFEEMVKAKEDIYVATIPSRQGFHLIVRPHKMLDPPADVSLHKASATNLYIPDGAR